MVKWLGHEGNHSPSCSAEVKNGWYYTFATLYAFVAWTGTLPLWYLLYLTTWNGVLLEQLIVPQLVKKFPAYCEPEGLLLCSQEPATCPEEN
jgi:hypothetical protein